MTDSLFNTVKSIAKIVLLSRWRRHKGSPKGDTVIVMGNGPSLNRTIAEHGDVIRKTPSMSVNFAALADVFFELQPCYYVMADPHFFTECSDPQNNLSMLRKAFTRISWPMTLFVPYRHLKQARTLYGSESVHICGFNAVGLEGFESFTHAAFSAGLGMPRPRNVLIPAIMIAAAEGYKRIIVTGADHSWMQTLSVTDDNEVVSVQPHFYSESENEEKRIRHEYRNLKLHDVVGSFAVAFKSYHDIERYARKKGIEILNATPGSFIDAFRRTSL